MSNSATNIDTPYVKSRLPKLFRRFRKADPVKLGGSVDVSLGAKISESIAHFLGTPAFILWLTIFCIVWITWNTLMPEILRFDSAEHGFTALTLMLSLQASYAAPLILFAQNRQADRDKVSILEDRVRAERNLADTEYLTREIEAIRIQLENVATRDYIRQELRQLLVDVNKSELDN